MDLNCKINVEVFGSDAETIKNNISQVRNGLLIALGIEETDITGRVLVTFRACNRESIGLAIDELKMSNIVSGAYEVDEE